MKRLSKRVNGLVMKSARQVAGLTQADLALEMGMARTSIVAIEKGTRLVDDAELNQLAGLLKLQPEQLSMDSASMPKITGIHIYFGYSVRTPARGEKCLYCGQRQSKMAYTYFGAPVCKTCWDTLWRETEDGKTDPPFDEITRTTSGERI